MAAPRPPRGSPGGMRATAITLGAQHHSAAEHDLRLQMIFEWHSAATLVVAMRPPPHTRTHTRTHARTHARTHTHTHTHTQAVTLEMDKMLPGDVHKLVDESRKVEEDAKQDKEASLL